jgi:hypothetical protein
MNMADDRRLELLYLDARDRPSCAANPWMRMIDHIGSQRAHDVRRQAL